jgi:hypothetical protein
MKIAKLFLILSVALWVSVPAFAQDPPTKSDDSGMKMKGMHEGMHKEMKAEMSAMSEHLDKLVMDMNAAATPEKKLDAVIAVVNEMAAQHKKMHEKMMQRREDHQHHEGGASPEAKK